MGASEQVAKRVAETPAAGGETTMEILTDADHAYFDRLGVPRLS